MLADANVNLMPAGMFAVMTLNAGLSSIPVKKLRVKVSTSGDMPKSPGKARGGLVRGIGTETSDSNPHMLSRNEYVVRAASVKKFGVDTFNALNEGRYPNRWKPKQVNVGRPKENYNAERSSQQSVATQVVTPTASQKGGRGDIHIEPRYVNCSFNGTTEREVTQMVKAVFTDEINNALANEGEVI